MQDYSIGGQEVKGDANEAISDIPQNRTLLVEKLTEDAPVKPEIVAGLKNIDEVFDHFKPGVKVDFEDSEGGSKEESLQFGGLSDFGVKGITGQSEFLTDLANQKEQSLKIIKQLKSNKMLKKALENEESKEALLNSMYALIKEIEDAG
jgi:predicted component of type VI protein secretion system